MKKSAKIFIKIITALLAVIIVICATLGIYYAASKDCTLTVSVNTEKELQEISGWGTSDCWWLIISMMSKPETKLQIFFF